MPRQKKLNYYQRWRQSHKAVTIYLSPEEYEALRQLAGRVGLTYRDLLYGAAKDVKKLYEEVVHKYFGVDELKNEYETKIAKLREEYESEITKLRQDYEAKIAELRQECEKLKQDYEKKLAWEYFHGLGDGRKLIKSIVFKRCEVKCPEDVLKLLED